MKKPPRVVYNVDIDKKTTDEVERRILSSLRFPPAPVQPILRDTYVWHYTDANGLVGILTHREFWASAAPVLNDPSEIAFGVRSLRSFVERNRDSLHPKTIAIACAITRKRAAVELPWRTYALSVSSSSKMLNQWLAYARPDGFAIELALGQGGFSPRFYSDGKDYDDGFRVDRLVDMFPVYYKRRHQDYMWEWITTLSKVQYISDNIDGEWVDAATRYYMETGLALCKHPAYQFENECRALFIATSGDVPFYRTRGARVVPFVKASFAQPGGRAPLLPIARVVCGPMTTPGTARVIQDLLRANGYKSKVETSKIPYAGQ